MKYIFGTNDDSLFIYFSGTEDTGGWTSKNPASFFELKNVSSGEFYVTTFFPENGYEYPEIGTKRYLLFYPEANVEYRIRPSNRGVKCKFYDAIYGENGDVLKEMDFTNEYYPSFSFEIPKIILAVFNYDDGINNFYNNNTDIYLTPCPVQFDMSSRYIRNSYNQSWNRTWNISGKLNQYRSLSEIEINSDNSNAL